MRYESAWRMGQWQSCAEMHSAVPGRPVGTNEAVLGCLKVATLLCASPTAIATCWMSISVVSHQNLQDLHFALS